ncbi:MAG: hypothetical protein ACMXYA_01930, partial [Candidatus Woesearchaeota archaeon]
HNLQPGTNTLRFSVTNENHHPDSPWNPHGITYRIDYSWDIIKPSQAPPPITRNFECTSTTVGQIKNVFLDFTEDFDAYQTSGSGSFSKYSDNFVHSGTHSGMLVFNQDRTEVIFTDLYKNNWFLYDFLEFYILPESVGSLYLNINGNEFLIEEYVVHTYSALEWNKVQIPLQNIFDSGNIKNMTFSINTQYVNFQNDNIYTFLVDTFVLRNTYEEIDFLRLEYCNAVSVGPINYFLDSTLDGSEGQMFACGISPFTPVGTRCCGATSRETFPGYSVACYAQRPMPENRPFDYVRFSLNDQTRETFCLGPTCELLLPTILTPYSDTILFSLSSPNQNSRFLMGETNGLEANVTFSSTGSFQSENSQDKILIELQQPRFIYGLRTYIESGEVQTSDSHDFYFCGETDNRAFIDRSQLRQAPVCSVVGEYFCSPQGFWSDDNSDVEGSYRADADSLSAPRETPVSSSQRIYMRNSIDQSSQGCCPENSCWHNGVCFANQANAPFSGVITMDGEYDLDSLEGNRCINGQWTNQEIKRGINNNEFGFCEKESQCLISTSIVDPIQPGTCIDSGKFYQDYFCQGGTWSTRTFLVAKALKEMAGLTTSDSFTLHCDYFEDVINFDKSTLTDSGRNYAEIFNGRFYRSDLSSSVDSLCNLRVSDEQENCVNNFCVLQHNNKFYLGTTFNQINSDENDDEFLNPVDVFNELDPRLELDCTGDVNEDGLRECVSSIPTHIWLYDEELRLLVHTDDTSSFWQNFAQGFQNIVTFILPFLRDSPLDDLIPDDAIVQSIFEKQNDDFHIAAFRQEEGKGFDAQIDYVVKYGRLQDDSQTINFICQGLSELNILRQSRGQNVLELRRCNESNPQDIQIQSQDRNDREIWSRITVALRDN